MSLSPPRSDSPLVDGLMRLRGAVRQAVELTNQIERGQAQMPLREHFEGLSSALDSSPFTITLVGLDSESRGAALGWLCGEDFRVLTLEVSGISGLVEVRLAERGYVLLKSGNRQEFDRLAPFLEAVRAADLVRQGDADAWLEPMHLELSAPRGLQGLRILMPESPQVLARNPALMARLRGRANLLAVAGPTDLASETSADAILPDLAADAPAHWAIITGALPTADFFKQGWPTLLGGRALPSSHLSADGQETPHPPFLTDERSALRRGLFGCQQLGRFEAALDMVEERIQGDLRLQSSRRKGLTRRAAALGDRGQALSLREEVDATRRVLGEGFSRLRTELADSQRERVIPTATPGNRMKNLLEDLSEEDLAREATKSAIRLTVAPGVLRKAERLVVELVREDIRQDTERINLALQGVDRDLTAGLTTAVEGLGVPSVDRFDGQASVEGIIKAIHLEPNYQGRLDKRSGVEGVFELAMHARRPLLLLTMMSSLGIPLFIKLRKLIAPAIVLVFLGGLWLARKGFREGQHERLEQELERIRNALGTELRRLYEQALRDWQGAALRGLQEIEKKVERDLEERLRSSVAQQTSRTARERVEVQDKLKVVDNRLRELGTLSQQAGRIRTTAAETRTILERATRTALDELVNVSGMK